MVSLIKHYEVCFIVGNTEAYIALGKTSEKELSRQIIGDYATTVLFTEGLIENAMRTNQLKRRIGNPLGFVYGASSVFYGNCPNYELVAGLRRVIELVFAANFRPSVCINSCDSYVEDTRFESSTVRVR